MVQFHCIGMAIVPQGRKIMPFTLNAGSDRKDWKEYGLEDYSEYCEKVNYINCGEDTFSGYGEWYYIPENPLPDNWKVIYFGTYGNDNSPGASYYTYAEFFDFTDDEELGEFEKRVNELESCEEFLDCEQD